MKIKKLLCYMFGFILSLSFVSADVAGIGLGSTLLIFVGIGIIIIVIALIAWFIIRKIKKKNAYKSTN